MYVKTNLSLGKPSSRRLSGLVAVLLSLAVPAASLAQQQVNFRVDSSTQRLEMVVNTSRVLASDNDVPRLTVNNRDVVKVVPLSPKQIQVSAVQPGVTQLNLWDSDGEVRTVDIVVYPDARRLQLVLQSEFPQAAIRVRPLDNSVVLAGYVDRPEIIPKMVNIAQDFYPKVINNIDVGGVQQVALNVQVMEVSRTKLRAFGTEFGLITGNDFIVNSAAGLIAGAASGATGITGTGVDTVRFGIVDGSDQFFGFIEALKQNNLIKVLAEPTLVTVSGRPASFQEGGEFPILVPQSLGVNSVDFKTFGTRVDFVPVVLGNGAIRLEVRPQVSEVDNSRGVDVNGVIVPGLRTRWVDTAVEMRAGQTLALAGLIQTRTEAEVRGLPWLSDLPWTGNLFRRQRETVNEIELLVLVRPELVAPLEPHEVPRPYPGESTSSPNDVDLFIRGYIEVPTCCPTPRCNDTNCGTQAAVYGAAPGMGPVVEGTQYESAPIVDGASMGQPMEQSEVIAPYGEADSSLYGGPATETVPYSVESNIDSTAPGTGTMGPGPIGQSPELIGPSGYDELNF